MSDASDMLPDPPRHVPLRVQWYLKYAKLATGWDALEIGAVFLLLLFLYLWGSRSFIERHDAAWEPIERKGIVDVYYFDSHRGKLPGYSCYVMGYTFMDASGTPQQGFCYDYVPWGRVRQEERYKTGDAVTLEKYKYSSDLYRASGTLAYRANWRPLFFFLFIGMIIWGLTWFAWRKLWFLRNASTTTGQLCGSEIVTGGARNDSYRFTVDGKEYTTVHVVLQPKDQPAPLQQQTVFYVTGNPKRAKTLLEISPNLTIENGRLKLRKFDVYALTSVALGLLWVPLLLTVWAVAIAQYLPF